MSANPSLATDSSLSTFSSGASASLIGLSAGVAFNPRSFDYGGRLLDSDVSVSLAAESESAPLVLSVSGLMQGDTVGLRLQDAGSPFAITMDPSLPEGFYAVFMYGDPIGIVGFGYDNGAQNAPFQLRFTTAANAETIETVIENLQFSTIAEPGNRTLSLSLSPAEGGDPLFARNIAVSLVPGIGGIADAVWIDTANPSGALFTLSDLPSFSYGGGKITINGVIGKVDIPSLVQGSMFSMQDPNQVQGNTYQVFWFSMPFATITVPGYHDTGDMTITFLESGTSSTLAEQFLNDLRLTYAGAYTGFGPTRSLTITAETASGVVAQSEATLTYGQPMLSDLNSPDRMRAGTGPEIIDADVTVDTPAGLTLAGARIEVTNLAAGDHVGLSEAGPLRVDGSGNLILSSYMGDVTIGTFTPGSAGYDPQTGGLVSTAAVVNLNADAPSWVLETIIENLTLESVGRFSTDSRNLNIAVYNAQNRQWFNSNVEVLVSGQDIDGLKEVHFNTGGSNPQLAPFVDTSVTLAPGDYTGWTLEVTTANGELGDSASIGRHIIGNRFFELQAQPDQSITLFYINEFNQPTAVGGYQGLPFANSMVGYGFRITVGQNSTWSAAMLEHLIESVTMSAGGPAGTQSSITYKLSNPQGVFYQDTVRVEKTDAVPGIDGLSSEVTVRSAVMALDGPALLDGDVTLPGDLGAGLVTVTVTGQVAGDVLGLRAVSTPAPGQLVLDDSGLLYRQGASDIELLGYVAGGTSGTPLQIGFMAGVTAAQIEGVIEALTFSTTSTVRNRELAITVTQNGQAALRGFVEVNLDTTPLIADLTRLVKFDATTIADTPMLIDSSVTLPTGLDYARSQIVVTNPNHVRIGVTGGYTLVQLSGGDFWIVDTMSGEQIGVAYLGSTFASFSFGLDATRDLVERVMESLTFTTSATDQASEVTVRLNLFAGSNSRTTIAMTDIRLQPALGDQTLTGTEGADMLAGDDGNDLLHGLGGDDLLSGMDCKDTLFGGDGNDTLYGGNGNDSLSGDAGDDVLSGLNGRDTLRGGDGNDSLMGGNGRDRLFGDAGNDTLLGEGGNDTLRGATGNDSLNGGSGHDSLYGDLGADTLVGAQGNDALFGGAGADRLFGGAGNDTLAGGIGSDRLNGGGGADVFLFDLADVGTGVDVILGFEQGQDMLMFTPALIDFLGSAGTSATEAIHWDLASRTLSLDFDAVGLTGGRVAIARFSGSIPETLTVDDFLFG